MKTYYMTRRPPQPGAMPKDGLMSIVELEGMPMVDHIGTYAYARLVYDRQLTDKEIRDYELVPAEIEMSLTPRQIMVIRHALRKIQLLRSSDDELCSEAYDVYKVLEQYVY